MRVRELHRSLDCTETLNLTVAEYERIGSSPVRFPVAIGHDFPEVENVVEENERHALVEENERYALVQERGVAAEEAAKLDPRHRSRSA